MIYRNLIQILIFSFFPVLLSAQVDIDSIRAEIQKNSGELRVDSEINLANALIYIDPQAADSIIQIAIEGANQLGSPRLQSKAILIKGSILGEQGKLYAAEELLVKAISIAESASLKDIQSQVLLSLGATYIRIGKYTEAAEAHFTGVRLAEEVGNIDVMLTHLMNLGVLKMQLGSPDESEQYLNQALEISIERNDLFRQAQLYGNLGYLEYGRNNMGNSRDYHRKSLIMFQQLGDKLQAAHAHNNLGFALNHLGEHSKAKREYTSALNIYEELGNNPGAALVLLNQARMKRQEGDFNSALRISNLALQKTANLGPNSQKADLLFFQHQLYTSLSQFENALAVFKKYTQVKDSISLQTNAAKIADLTAKYDFESLSKEAEINERQIKLEQLQLKQRNQLLIAGGILLIIVALALLWNRSLLKSKLRLAIKETNLKSKEHELERQKLLQFTEELIAKNDSLEGQIQVENGKSDSEEQDQSVLMLEKLSESLVDEKDWKKFSIYFDAIYPNFFEQLNSASAKKLTLSEKRLAALIKLDLTNKEVASVLNISRNSVVKAKYRLRQHLGLVETKDLEDFLVTL